MKGVVNFNTKDWEIVLKALANRRRLEILGFLKKREAAVGEIAEHINLSFKSTSRHLGVLFYAEVVNKDKRSLEVYYSLNKKSHPQITSLLKIVI